MKKQKFFKHIFFFFTFFFLLVSTLYAQDDMVEINPEIEISATSLHEWMPYAAYNSIDNEFLVVWHTTGVREEGGENMYSIHAQRISTDGTLIGEPFLPIKSFGPERRILPRAAYNYFTNQYMISLAMGQELTEWDPFIMIMANDGTTVYEPVALSEQLTKTNHVNIVFNTIRRQYFVVYNDSRSGIATIYGVILDEDGSIIKEDFTIKSSEDLTEGGFINAFACFNPADDTYLVNWEDFRHVSTWEDTTDIYGALIDGDGTILVNDIPMVDDNGMDNEGDQRVQNIAYNSARNEFLASWWDSRPSLDGGGIVGRIINADGTPKGEDFVLADAPGSQSFPHVVYSEKRNMYFALWDDTRNVVADMTEERDIYAKWLSPDGEAAGSDFPVFTGARSQRYSEVSYCPLMDRLLLVWRDEVDEEVLDVGIPGHVVESGGNVMGKIYGVPSFLTGRVVKEETGTPVEDANIFILGLAWPKKAETNIGGWFHIPKDSYRNGRYYIIVLKQGYKPAIKSVSYEGEPLQVTIQIPKRR